MATTIQPNSTNPRKSELAAQAAKRIQSIHDVNKYSSYCFYGRNGSGKTRLAASSGLKTLIIDCEEKGTETLVGLEYAEKCDVFQLERWDELNWIYWHLKTHPGLYEVAVLDTVTMLSALGLKWIMGDERSRDTSLDPLMADRRHYGKLNMALGQAIIDWRNLPLHTIFLAQERTETVEDEGSDEAATVLEVVPSLTKGPRGVLMSAVGTIGRVYTKDVTKVVKGKETTVTERRLLVGAHAKYASKTRIQGLPRILRNPTMKDILDHRAKYGEVPAGQVDMNNAEEID